MAGVARRVRHLRLAADSEAAVRRVLPALEDALRTATLPDPGGRLLVVRRLALGRIAADAAPSTLALALERAVSASAVELRSADDPAAGQAPVVAFRDPLHAHVALALRLIEGPAPVEWFWSPALPAWTPRQSRPEALQALAASLARLPEATVARPAWFAALLARGHRDALRAVFGDEPSLSRGPSGSPPPRHPGRPVAASARPVSDARAPERAPPIAGRTATAPQDATSPPAAPDAPDAALVAPGPERLPVAVPGRAADRAAAAVSAARSPAASSAPGDPPAVARPADDLAAAAIAPSRPQASTGGLPHPPEAVPAGSTHDPQQERAHRALAALAQAPWQGLPTTAGGIAFVLPVLARLGFSQALGADPAGSGPPMVAAVFGLLLTRLDIAADDPAWALAAGPDAPRPDLWQVAPWALAVRRWLRRQARIGLASLVRRPALLALTATHLDLHFELAAVALPVRRAGLDVDPGWLPWYGRVVGFHYGRLSP